MAYRSGEEYEDIFPVWDWRRLPGTTCDQNVPTQKASGFKPSFGQNDYAGVINDSTNGIAAMIYEHNAFSARKAWFMLEESIVCLGAGIQGESLGSVYTSVEQSLLSGGVTTSSSGTLEIGKHSTSRNSWVHHNEIGYQIFNSATIHFDTVSGNWLRAYPEFSNRPVIKDVFSIWIDHGKNPNSEYYSYILYPGVKASQMDEKIAKSKTKILNNSETIQAIQNKNEIMAVFYKKGKLQVDEKTFIEVDTPCLLILTEKNFVFRIRFIQVFVLILRSMKRSI